jgi:hypothetical protein
VSMAVVRNGTGPLHIAWVESDGFDTLCDRTLPHSSNVMVWTKRRGMAARIWKEWRHCPTCEREDRMHRNGSRP